MRPTLVGRGHNSDIRFNGVPASATSKPSHVGSLVEEGAKAAVNGLPKGCAGATPAVPTVYGVRGLMVRH